MRNFAGVRPGPRQLRARHAEPRPALVVLRRHIPEQTGGGGTWFPVTTYPELDAGFNWNTLAPRTGVVLKLTEDGKNVAKASYSRYYEVMYTGEFADASTRTRSTPAASRPTLVRRRQRQRHWSSRRGRSGAAQHSAAAAEPDRSEPARSEERRDHVRLPARAGEQLVAQRRLDPALVQRPDGGQNCDGRHSGRPATRRATVHRPGPGQPRRTRRRSADHALRRAAAVPRQRTFVHTNCGNNVRRLHAALQGARAVDQQAHVEPLADAGLVRVVAARRRHRRRSEQPEPDDRRRTRWAAAPTISRTPSS